MATTKKSLGKERNSEVVVVVIFMFIVIYDMQSDFA